MAQTKDICPRCGEGQLLKWHELNADEHEVIRRLPGSAAYSFRQRVMMHRWCAKCWYEETTQAPRNA